MAKTDFSIKVTCGIDVDEETAELALKIVNIYCNQNDKRVTTETNDDGRKSMFFEEEMPF